MAQRDPKTGKFVRTKPDYKAMYEDACQEREAARSAYMGAMQKVEYKNYRISFLLEHAGPILRWRYNRKFKKGE